MRDKSVQPVAPAESRPSDTLELGGLATTETEAAASGAVTETHRSTLLELPSSWLDRLLLLGRRLPVSEGPEAAMREVVQTVAALLPEYSVAGRVAIDDGGRRIVYSEPPRSNEQPRSDRLFPDAAFERVIALPEGDGWLHAASDDPQLDDDRAPFVLLLERAAGVAADGLARVRAHEQTAKVKAELEAMKRSMVQAEKLASLGQMAAGMVHELNNPLTSIVAYTDYMLRRVDKFDEEDVERIRRIAESANRMLRFTRDLVSYARPASEIAVPVALHAVIERALAFCDHEISQAGVSVEKAFDARVTSIRGKPEQLAQVFVNLVTNACHAMISQGDGHARGAKLTLSTEPVGESSVRVTVDDTGHGISDENIPRVFAPFFTTKGAGKGTGLGLSIVKSIVEAHEGEISVESDAQGTRFILLFPLVVD